MSLVEITEEEVELGESYDHGEDLASVICRNNYAEFLEFLHPDMDVNMQTKQGLSLAHLAAKNNNLDILKELVLRGVDIHSINDKCESVLQTAVQSGGSAELIKFLLGHKVGSNFQDKKGNAALHAAVESGNLDAVEVLCQEPTTKINLRNKDGETPLTLAVVKGKVDIVKALLDQKVELNGEDKDGMTPLHHAIMRHQTTIALMLINSGAHVNKPDRDRNTPLHLATSECLLSVVQALCAYGCRADCYNAGGLTALQVGARQGHTEAVRCLLLAGASPYLASRHDRVYPDIMAYARGHKATGHLLHTMTPERRAICIEQLIPADRPVSRVKVKILGPSRAGKTELVAALRTSYIRGFIASRFRHSLDMFSGATAATATSGSNTTDAITLQDRSGIPNGASASNHDIRYEVDHEEYTRGIDVQTVQLAGADSAVSIWEFSGYQPYLCTYDHFLGEINCLHIVCVDLTEPPDLLKHKLRFWLEFLAARLAHKEPLFDAYSKLEHKGGRGQFHFSANGCVAKVIVVGTRCNSIPGERNVATGLFYNQPIINMFQQLKEDLQLNLDIHENLLFVDSVDKGSPELKYLRSLMLDYRAEIVSRLPSSNLLVDTVASRIHELIPNQEFPCVSWQQFVQRVRAKINPLCNEDHLKELIQQLQYMGEVIYLESESEPDIVVLSPNWLCSDVVGYLLSFENISSARVTGSFSRDELEVMLGVAADSAPAFLGLLCALELCVEVQSDQHDPDEQEGDTQFEMPCLNFVEGPPTEYELAVHSRDVRWLGLQIHLPEGHAPHLMPRIQAQLRKSVLEQLNQEDTAAAGGADIDDTAAGGVAASSLVLPMASLDQWFRGSLLTVTLETGTQICNIGGVLMTLEGQGRIIEVKAFYRVGPSGTLSISNSDSDPLLVMFGFFQDTFNVALQTVREVAPQMDYELFCMGNITRDTLLSRKFELYSQGEVARALLECQPDNIGKDPDQDNGGCALSRLPSPALRQALFLDHGPSARQLQPGPALHVSNLRPPTLRRLARLLDPPHPSGRDWCLLGLSLGLEKALIARLDSCPSPTAATLSAWMARNGPRASLGTLVTTCQEIDRKDVAFLLTAAIPFYQFVPALPGTHPVSTLVA